MTKLSAVIITLNEERNIGRCLESLQNVADEIIVVDSGSTDQTEAICSRFQVKFIKQDWLGYGAQKNLGATHTTNNYIFSIDADEALSETLKESILYEKKQGFLAAGYAMNILTNYCGHWVKHSGWYPGRKNRIYDKTQVKWNDSGIHEHLVFTPNQTINFLDGDLLHYSYHTRDDQQRKLDSYTQLFIEKRIKQGKSPSIIRAIFSACACFLSMYIFQLGFLDGRIGFTIARFSAIGKYRKYRMRQVPIKHKKIEQLNPFPLPDSTNIHTHVFQSGEQRRFSIIIPTWNNLPMLRLCVESLRKNSRFKHQIILHINEGKDGTREWAEANNIDYSHTASNVGVCLAVNSAATLANTDYIVYMNDD